MPTYEYRCSSCDYGYETREGFDASPRQPCPRCGAEAKRVLYAPPIVFKGNGFYITDSRKGSSATVGADGAATASSDSKPSPATSSEGAKPAPAAAASDPQAGSG